MKVKCLAQELNVMYPARASESSALTRRPPRLPSNKTFFSLLLELAGDSTYGLSSSKIGRFAIMEL